MDLPVRWSQLSIAIMVFKPIEFAPSRKSVVYPIADAEGMINHSKSPFDISFGNVGFSFSTLR